MLYKFGQMWFHIAYEPRTQVEVRRGEIARLLAPSRAQARSRRTPCARRLTLVSK